MLFRDLVLGLLIAAVLVPTAAASEVVGHAWPGHAYDYDAPSAATTPPAQARIYAPEARRDPLASSGVVRLVSGSFLAAKAGTGGINAVRLGQAGEDAVRGAYNIGDKVPISVAGRGRIPDGLTTSTLSEVKNTASLSYTQQLRDFAQYAQQTGRSFDLYVRPTTRLSGPLQREVANGSINLRFIP